MEFSRVQEWRFFFLQARATSHPEEPRLAYLPTQVHHIAEYPAGLDRERPAYRAASSTVSFVAESLGEASVRQGRKRPPRVLRQIRQSAPSSAPWQVSPSLLRNSSRPSSFEPRPIG